MDNYFKMQIPAKSENEAFARNTLAAFVLPLSPTVEELNDLKTAVSEAVTNCVVHAYDGDGSVAIVAEIHDNMLFVTISDRYEARNSVGRGDSLCCRKWLEYLLPNRRVLVGCSAFLTKLRVVHNGCRRFPFC